MNLRSAVKAVVPTDLVRLVRTAENHARLALIDRETFDAANLGRAFNARAVFSRFDYAADFDALHHFGEFKDGVCPGDRRAIYYLMRHLKPESVLEIGTHVCASAIYIVEALKKNGRGKLTTVDIADCWRADVDAEFIESDSLAFMRSTDRTFDFIFLDGDHSAKTVYREVAAALRILRPGGYILLHDYYPNGVPISGPSLGMKRVMMENAGIHAAPLGVLPWETKDGSRVTSLALVIRIS